MRDRSHCRSWFALALVAGCSTEFNPHECSQDSDCEGGLVCEVRENNNVCVAATDAPIVIGQSAPITGTNQALGTNMKLGIELAFKEQNDKGGIRGRPLVLEFRDDGYDPPLAEAAARALTDAQDVDGAPRCPSTASMIAGNTPISDHALKRGPKAVLAIVGNVGTPTMVRSAPVAVETGTVFFGAFTGAATVLRNTVCGECAKYIFNYRASYAQEARATMEYFKSKRSITSYKNLISFDQNDSFGQAGYDGLVAAYKAVVGDFPGNADPVNPIARFRYARNDDTSVPSQANAAEAYITNLMQDQPTGNVNVGILMTDTYGAGTAFIQLLRDWQMGSDPGGLGKATRLKLAFSNVSFVGPNALSDRLKQLGTFQPPSGPPLAYVTDVVVSQVVPNYQSDNSEIVLAYNRAISDAGAQANFTSLEGYIAARVFIAGLLNNKGPYSPDSLINAFETLPDLGLGIGATAGFSVMNHQYSQSVWGTILNPDGTFRNLYFWRDGSPIQFFE
jgi:branched-chain amino acid transport system substrate-binding protein